ncbi:MAG: XTP/dITP diphosphatase [Spirochaetes bacterium]|nr:XTP/dITP diphosphatase [Spirochaetota bacterium]
MKLIIATKNENKIKEIGARFSDIKGIEIISLADFNNVPSVIEDGLSFKDNALKKAREYSAFTGQTVLSDDSGLEVQALHGAPGIYSARYSGPDAEDCDNNKLLLENLKGVPDAQRGARFVCVIAIVQPDGNEYITEGTCEGVITRREIGNNGFGYDPVLYLPELGKTMAELTIDEKNSLSHRAKALEKAKEILKKINH